MPRRTITLPVLFASITMVACGSDDKPPSTESKQVEIVSWWTAPGEKEALEALIQAFNEQHPDVQVVNSATPGADNLEEQLQTRLVERRPPDTFQAGAGSKLLQWVRGGTQSIIEPLDDLAEAGNWRATFPAPLLEQLSHNGSIYGVPVNIERNNAMFYNKAIFASNGLTPPTTLDEFFTVADTLKSNGITALSLGIKYDWPMSIVIFDWILLAQAGPEYHTNFFHGNADPLDPQIRTAAETSVRLLDYANSDAADLDWDEAVGLVYDGKAAMNMHGDWAKGYLISRGWTPDVEFGQIPAPGTSSSFVFSADTFALPVGAQNRAAARDLLSVFGSPEAQVAFNLKKGSIPARTDADKSAFDALAQQTIDQFESANTTLIANTGLYVNPDFSDHESPASGKLGKDRNVEDFIQTLAMYYDILKAAPSP